MAADQGHAKAQHNLGVAYANGDRRCQRHERGGALVSHGGGAGGCRGAIYFGLGILPCIGVAEDPREAVRWYRMAAEQGYAEAQNVLGDAYINGKGVAKDPREAVRWFEWRRSRGMRTAQYILGLAYSFGIGVAEDPREAVRWYRMAAEQGYAEAQNVLGVAYWFTGEGVAKDLQRGGALVSHGG